MLLLNNSDLPSTTEAATAKAPLLRTQSIAAPNVRPPFALVSAYGSYGLRPGFEAANLNLPDPAYVGRLFALPFNASETEDYTVSAVTRVSLGGQLYTVLSDFSSIYGALPLTAWANSQTLSLYAPVGAAAGDTVTVQLTLAERVPISDDDLNYTLDLSEFIGSNTFNVSRVTSEGLTFAAAANSGDPQTGEFVQTGDSLKFYGSSTYQPRTFRPVQIEGVWQADLPAMTGVLATFDLSPLSVGVVDELTYLGIVCRPVADLYSVQIGDLLANRQLATVCVPYNRALWVRAAVSGGTGVSALGELSYPSSID